MPKIYLNIPYVEKDEAKLLAIKGGVGLQWDPTAKKWYVVADELPETLKKFPIVATTVIQKSTKKAPQTYTDEQRQCINTEPTKGESILWHAFAGTGKTTCLVGFAQARPNKKFLYLAFNKSVAEEARTRFPNNTRAATIHSVAFANTDPNLRKKLTANLKPNTVATVLNLNFHKKADRIKAANVEKIITRFFATPILNEPTQEWFLEHFQKQNDPLKPHQNFTEEHLELSKKLWVIIQDPNHPEKTLTHDAYLKIFALSNPPLDYDYILLDEGQDTNPITAEIVLNQPAPKIIVGDSAQSIYSYRLAEDAMQKITTHDSYKGKTLHLTQSFRFGTQIANLANNILHYFKGETQRLKGLNPDPGILLRSERTPWLLPEKDIPENPNKNIDHTIITRSNAQLFVEAYQTAQKIQDWKIKHNHKGKIEIGFIGTQPTDNFSPMQAYKFGTILDILNLKNNQTEKIFNPYIKAFDSFKDLQETAESDTAPDQEIAGPVKLVNQYHNKLPQMVHTILQFTGDPNSPQCYARFTTAHKAKGLEWDRVKLTNDFIELIRGKTKPRLANTQDYPPDEFHLIYMAATRAQKELQLNQKLEDFIFFLSNQNKN